MPIEKWSDALIVVHLGDEPQMTDDLEAVDEQADRTDVVLDLGAVHYVNSSAISKLLKLRKKMVTNDRRLVLCNVTTQVWGAFLVTGLDKVFEFSDNVPTALATVQITK